MIHGGAIVIMEKNIMYNWYFPSRAGGETEGFSNAGLAEFRGNPLQALAREICQNSLDAADGSGKPVRVEFHQSYMEISKFPGMNQMKKIIESCQEFWGKEGDANTKKFLARARRSLAENKFFVLRVSDFNTKGVQGAFSDKNITPWGSLVKGNSFSVKPDEMNAAGSYGIGKAAPFVSSEYQTVFYRTYDIEGVRAVLGVSRLMAHKIVVGDLLPDEDPVRRSVGYFGENSEKKPAKAMKELDDIYERTERGTDLFIPGFSCSTNNEEWVKAILLEIVENFLYSVYSEKLEVVVEDKKLTKSTLPTILSYLGTKAKNSNMFYEVIRTDNKNVIEEKKIFHSLGTLRLRLLYGNDLSKKVLVVRNSGMKISNIPSLPRGISYVGFFELQGDKLNEFFRAMENPKHNAWEPKRHENPDMAKKYKEEVEDWVRSVINEKLIEISGEESIIDIGDCFNYKENNREQKSDERKAETIVDTVKNIEVIEDDSEDRNKFSVRGIGGSEGQSNTANRKGSIDDTGSSMGHRTRTGSRKGGSPTGRKGYEKPDGLDRIYSGKREVYVSARIISHGNGINRLIFTAEESIEKGEMEIVTKGENGKNLQLYVLEAIGENVKAVSGHIEVSNIPANVKQTIEFKISSKRNYAMG
jgi:hypothetical protein